MIPDVVPDVKHEVVLPILVLQADVNPKQKYSGDQNTGYAINGTIQLMDFIIVGSPLPDKSCSVVSSL